VVRSVLGVLQQDGGAAPRAPVPGLARLDELISGARGAGLDVRTVVEGTPRPVTAAADLAAFRVVQEALTNVRRHSGAGSATVTITYTDAELEVRVDDDGRGPDARRGSEGGFGIRGMRERAAALGGGLEAGPRPEGGFRVVARLPLGELR
jgi:signal transduction histidine kinase